MTRPSPVVAKFELAVRLRNQRRAINIPVSDITKHFKFSRNYWSAVENERTTLSEERLRQVLELLEFDPKEHNELLALRKLSLQTSWWDTLDLPEQFGSLTRLYGLEAGASHIHVRIHVIPALLQTPDYTQAVLAHDPFTAEFEKTAVASAREHRQDILFDPEPTKLTAILGEGILRHQLGGRLVLQEQLKQILQFATDPRTKIDLRILPFTAPGGATPGGSETFLSFPSGHLPLVHATELAQRMSFSEDPQLVKKMKAIFDRNLESTLNHNDSLQFIADLIKGLDDTPRRRQAE